MKITGVLSPCITLFDEKNEIDVNATYDLWKDLFENHVDGLFVGGSYGLGPLMTTEERIELFKIASRLREEFPDRSIIAHVGAADTYSAVQMAQAAENLGFDAVAAVPAWYNKYKADQVYQYFVDIINATSLPTYAYNNPSTSGFSFTLPFVQKLQAAGLKGLKDASIDYKFLTEVLYDVQQNEKDFKVILGTENTWLTWNQIGGDTIIGGMTNYLPDVDYALKCILEGNNMQAKIEAYNLVANFRKKVLFDNSTICSHLALVALGKYAGYTRAPLSFSKDDPRIEQLRLDIEAVRNDMKSIVAKYSALAA